MTRYNLHCRDSFLETPLDCKVVQISMPTVEMIRRVQLIPSDWMIGGLRATIAGLIRIQSYLAMEITTNGVGLMVRLK